MKKKISTSDFYQTPYKNFWVDRDGVILNTGTHGGINPVSTKYSDKDGYDRVWVMENSKRKFVPVHRIVARTFIEKPEDNFVVNHKNGIRHDNRVENLEWLAPADNERHARTHLGKRLLGEKASRSKLKSGHILEIRALEGRKHKDIAKLYEISIAQVGRILRRENWSHL